MKRRHQFEPSDFDLFCREMLPRTRQLAFSITGNHQDAEDVSIEALARCLAHWSKLRDQSWKQGWVLRVTANLALDLVKRKPVPEFNVIRDGEFEKVLDDRGILVPAIRQLPRRQQQALVLRHICDLPYSDIARVMKISEGAVKTHIHRALASLRTTLGSSILEGGLRVHRSA